MIYNLAHNGNKLITFTIDGTTYQAIKGMTWGEWIDSEYNVNQKYYSLSNNTICKLRKFQVAGVIVTDTIKDNSAYTLIDISGSSK